jgi:hypothetical protein
MATAPASPIPLLLRLHGHTRYMQHHHRTRMPRPASRTPRPSTRDRVLNLLQCLQLGQEDQACTDGRRTRGTKAVVTKPAQTPQRQTYAVDPRTRASARHDPARTRGHTTYFSASSWGKWTRPAPMATTPASPNMFLERLHMKKHRKHNNTSTTLVNSPALPCKRTQRPHTHNRAHNVLQCLQLGQVDQACADGRRTRGADTIVTKAARIHAAHTTAPPHTRAIPCKRTHNDPAHTAERTTYFSACSWGKWTRPATMADAPASSNIFLARLHKYAPQTQPHIHNTCNSPTRPCKHTPGPRTHNRAHNILQCL